MLTDILYNTFMVIHPVKGAHSQFRIFHESGGNQNEAQFALRKIWGAERQMPKDALEQQVER